MTEKPYKVGFTDGVFDLFHVGHLNLLERAKETCEYLIAGVHADHLVAVYKQRLPVIPAADRRRILAALRCVDRAVVNETRDKIELWKLYHFNVIYIGDDWKGTERWNSFEKQFRELGVDVVYLPYTPGISTTQIFEKLR